MLTILGVIFVIFFLLPSLGQKTEERRIEQRERDRLRQVIREEAKRGKRWG